MLSDDGEASAITVHIPTNFAARFITGRSKLVCDVLLPQVAGGPKSQGLNINAAPCLTTSAHTQSLGRIQVAAVPHVMRMAYAQHLGRWLLYT